MSNPVVLITGALTGIGRATALAFAREGARLVVSGRHDDAGNALAAELRDLGAQAEFAPWWTRQSPASAAWTWR
jgi:NAD(P)-dependent dehydrogenase (short-subunit alcohol dehydrogenase family)